MDYRDNRQRWAESHQVVHFYAGQWCTFTPALTRVMDGTQLFSRMRRPVMVNADQSPQYADVRNAGHDGGDFLFVRKR